jgi:DNA replication protein DnaC
MGGHQLVHAGFTVLYRSIFDAVRDFLHDEAFEGHDRIMTKYLKPDLLILDDMGLKQLPTPLGTIHTYRRRRGFVTAITPSSAKKSKSSAVFGPALC